MEQFTALALNGAVFGALYSLVAAGLVLTYSTSRMFNFGYGAIAFVTALFYYQLNTGFGWPAAAAAALAILVFAPAMGLLLNVLVFRPLADADEAAKIVATVGLFVALPALGLWIVEILGDTFGIGLAPTENIVTVAGLGPQPKEVWTVGSVLTVDSTQVVILVLAVVCSAGLWFLLRHTRLGLQMRASVDRPELAEARGVDGRRLTSVSWALGFMLAGVAGVAGAPILGLYPDSYAALLFVAATAAVIGRLSSIPLALVGGLLLGVSQNLVAGYATFAQSITGFSTSVPFLFLFVALLVLGWDRRRAAGQATEAEAPVSHSDDLPMWCRVLPRAVALIALVTFIFALADRFWLGLVVQGLAYGVILLSFVVVTGLGRMVSLAQATFVTVAAMFTGFLVGNDISFWLAMPAGVLVAVLAGLVVALPALRLGGLFLALATLALAFLGDRVLFAWNAFRNSSSGWRLRRPSIGPFDLADDRVYAAFLLIVLGLVALLVFNLRRSRTGRAIASVQASAPAAASVGLSVVRSRLVVFAVSAGIAGLGGVLLATANQSITNGSFPPLNGLMWLLVIVLFGVSRIEGAIIGGIMLGISGEVIGWFSQSAYMPSILFGLAAIQLATAPEGVIALWAYQLRALRRRFARRAMPADEPLVEKGAELDTTTKTAAKAAPPLTATPMLNGAGRSLTIHGVHAGYGEIEVLHGIDLSLAPGAITAVLGMNGAGKSTLCRVVSGAVPVTAGAVAIDGHEVTKQAAHLRARRGLYFAPEARGIFPELDVEENLSLTLRGREEVERVYERFPQLGERRTVLAGSLSGGEQQMLALAPVVVKPPRVVVADEPSLGLAPMVVNTVMDVLGELRAQGSSVLLAEEKSRHVLALADRVAVLQLGNIVWEGPASDVDHEMITSTYLHKGVP